MARVAETSKDEEHVKLRDKAYDAFTHHLLSRELRPGQFISQRELVQLTGLPLGAIRELIPRLEAEGLIVTVPQRGMQVAQIDISLVKEAFQFRLFLEREAISLFAQNASDAQIAAIRSKHEAIIARSKHERSPQLIADAQAVDWGFHDSLIDFLGNRIISNTYRVNSIKIRLIRQQSTRLDNDLVDPVMQEHLRIIHALEARDVNGAVTLLSQHIESARARALQL